MPTRVFDDGKPDRAHRRAFLAVDQTQAAPFDVDLAPSEIDDLPAAAAGHCEDPEDLAMQAIVVALLRLSQNAAQDPVFRLAQPPVAHLVFRFAQAMGRVVIDHTGFHRVGEYPAQKSHCADRRAAPPADDGLAAQLFGFHHDAGLSGDDVLHQVVHVWLGDVADPSGAEQGDDVPANAAHINLYRRGLLGAAAFAHDQAGFHILYILFAELLDR